MPYFTGSCYWIIGSQCLLSSLPDAAIVLIIMQNYGILRVMQPHCVVAFRFFMLYDAYISLCFLDVK